MNDEERQTIITRLLELAKDAEQIANLSKRSRHHAVANRHQGRAAAYYHCARLLGWRMIGEGDTPADHLLERDRQGA